MFLAVVADRPEGWTTVAVSDSLAPTPRSGVWQKLRVGFRAPPGLLAVRVILHGPPESRGGPLCGSIWWDDLRLIPRRAGQETGSNLRGPGKKS